MAAAAPNVPGTSLSVTSKSAPLLPRWEGRGDRSLRSAHRSRPHRLVMIKVNFASFNWLEKSPDHDITSEKKLMEASAKGGGEWS